MRIAITTPTGKIGRELVRILLDQGGHDLVLLARNPDRLTEEKTRGAEIVQGDQSNASFVRRATSGADAIFWLIPPDFAAPDYGAHQRAITEIGVQAVRENSIPHAVMLSSIGGHLPSGTGPIAGLHAAEELFRRVDSGLTILRPAYFMENFLVSIDTLRQRQSIYLPLPAETRIPMIATRDIAAAAAKFLAMPKPTGHRIAPLHGPRDWSFEEAAQVFGRILNQEIRFVQIEPEMAKSFLLKMGASENAADSMLEMYSAMRSGHLQAEYPRSDQSTTPTTLEVFAREVLAPMVQAAAVAD